MSDKETMKSASIEIDANPNGAELTPKRCETGNLSDSANQVSGSIDTKNLNGTQSNDQPAADDESTTTDVNANEQSGPLILSLSNPDLPSFQTLQSRLDTLMADAVTSASLPTVESLENLQSIVGRFERMFGQFRQETESAIADCRREFVEIRRKFEMLKRIRQSLFIEFVSRRATRHLDGETDGPPEPKRKRWGKKSTIGRRCRR